MAFSPVLNGVLRTAESPRGRTGGLLSQIFECALYILFNDHCQEQSATASLADPSAARTAASGCAGSPLDLSSRPG
jgi:hypothetical protein